MRSSENPRGYNLQVRKKKDASQLHRNLGQLLIVGFDGTEISPRLRALLTRLQPAGVILFARNIKGAEETFQLLKDCQTCVSEPLLTCIDLEGGRVDRFRNVLGPAPSAADVFATRDRRLFRKHGEIIGRSCRALGFNTDFAPVVDLALAASRTVMSSRAVSADPQQVVIYAREFLAGLRSAGVVGAAKHFPGLGPANLDTHLELPVVRKAWKQLWQEDMVPYRALRRQLAHDFDRACELSGGHPRWHARLAFEEVDWGYLAPQDRLSRTDRLGRSRNGRSAEGGARSRKRPSSTFGPGGICASSVIRRIL